MTTGGYWATLQRRQFGRRAVLRGGATGAVGLMAASLIGCRSGGTPAGKAVPSAPGSVPATGAPKTGGNIRIEQEALTSNWDPYRVANGSLQPYSAITDRLIALHPSNFTFEGMLIKSWEAIQTGTDYVLHVRQGVKYENKAPTNGRLFDAADVVHNIKYAAGLLDKAGTAAPTRSSWYFGISSVTAVDANTVSLKLSKPNAAILSAMADMRQSVIPREIPDAMPFKDFAKFPSIGPFLMKEYVDGEYAKYVRNPQYWDQPRPYIDASEMKWFSDTSSASAALLTDEIDLLRVKGRQVYEQISGKPGVVVHTWPSRVHYVIYFNAQKFPDPRLWRAIHLIHNYKENADAIHGPGQWEYSGPISRALPGALKSAEVVKMPGWNPATKNADIAEGVKLFEAMGFPAGKGLNFEVMPNAGTGPNFDQAIRLQGNLKAALPQINFNVKAALDPADYNRRLSAGSYDGFSFQINEATDTRLALENFKTGGTRNYGRYSNPKVNPLIERAFGEADKDMINTAKEVQDILLKDGFPLIITAGSNDYVGARDRIQGMQERGGPSSPTGGNLPATERKYLWIDAKRK